MAECMYVIDATRHNRRRPADLNAVRCSAFSATICVNCLAGRNN